MTSLDITPNYSRKTARFVGTAAAGEHVLVTIYGASEWYSNTLRLRVMSPGGVMAVFPVPEDPEPNDDEGGESGGEEQNTTNTWTVADDNISCELNLNTVQMLAALRCSLESSMLVVLDDPENHTIYFKDTFPFSHWPRIKGDEIPFDLDRFPGLIEGWKEQMDNLALSAERVDTPDAYGRVGVKITAWNGKGEEHPPVMVYDGATGATGATGPKGDAFTYEDFTEEQLAQLKGEPGEDAVVDATLSNEGEAADAKATGDAIDAAKEEAVGIANEAVESASAANTTANGVASSMQSHVGPGASYLNNGNALHVSEMDRNNWNSKVSSAQLAAESAARANADAGRVQKSAFQSLVGEELSNTATQKEIRLMVKKILGVLQGAAICVAFMLALPLLGIEAQTVWEEVPPTSVVKDVVEQFAPAPGNYEVVSNAAMISASQPWVRSYVATNSSSATSPVTSVNGQTGAVVIAASDVGALSATNGLDDASIDWSGGRLTFFGFGGAARWDFGSGHDSYTLNGWASNGTQPQINLHRDDTYPGDPEITIGDVNVRETLVTATNDIAGKLDATNADGTQRIYWDGDMVNFTYGINVLSSPSSFASVDGTYFGSYSLQSLLDEKIGAADATNIVNEAVTSYVATNAVVALNQSVQYAAIASGAALVILAPAESSGHVRDWVVYANAAADNTPLVLPTGQWYAADEAYTNALMAGVTVLYFSELPSGGYAIGRQELKPITIGD